MDEITGGSEKQNAWATQIAADWIAEINREIENNSARPESDNVSWYTEKLEASKSVFIAGLKKITSKQVIDLHTASRNPVSALIAKARVRNA